VPSGVPSGMPSNVPSDMPSGMPSSVPSMVPSTLPSFSVASTFYIKDLNSNLCMHPRFSFSGDKRLVFTSCFSSDSFGWIRNDSNGRLLHASSGLCLYVKSGKDYPIVDNCHGGVNSWFLNDDNTLSYGFIDHNYVLTRMNFKPVVIDLKVSGNAFQLVEFVPSLSNSPSLSPSSDPSFFIQSLSSPNLCLLPRLKDDSDRRLILKTCKDESLQKWSSDPFTGFLRSTLNNQCIIHRSNNVIAFGPCSGNVMHFNDDANTIDSFLSPGFVVDRKNGVQALLVLNIHDGSRDSQKFKLVSELNQV